MLDTSTSAFISHECTYENMLTAKEIIARHGKNMNMNMNENALKFWETLLSPTLENHLHTNS